MPNVARDKVMTVSSEALYRAITDFENYPKFLSEVVSAKREAGSTPTKARVVFELEIVKRFEYTLDFEMDPGKRVEWKLVESNFFKTNNGLWKLEPKGANETQVHYELDVGFGFLVPGWISRKLTEVNLPKMFDSFEARAKAI